MTARSRPPAIYHVAPDPAGGWTVQKKGADLPSARTENKDQAIARARELASRSRYGRVVVHNQDGTVEDEEVVEGPQDPG